VWILRTSPPYLSRFGPLLLRTLYPLSLVLSSPLTPDILGVKRHFLSVFSLAIFSPLLAEQPPCLSLTIFRSFEPWSVISWLSPTFLRIKESGTAIGNFCSFLPFNLLIFPRYEPLPHFYLRSSQIDSLSFLYFPFFPVILYTDFFCYSWMENSGLRL